MTGHSRLALPDGMLVPARVNPYELATRHAGERRVIAAFDTSLADHLRQVEVDLLAGQRLRPVAPDISQHMRGQRTLGIVPFRLHIDIHPGERFHRLGPARQCLLLDIAPCQERHRQALHDMRGHRFLGDDARYAERLGQSVYVGVHSVDGVLPPAAPAQLFNVIRDAVASPVAGQQFAVAVENLTARPRHLHPPDALADLVMRQRGKALHLNPVQRHGQKRRARREERCQKGHPPAIGYFLPTRFHDPLSSASRFRRDGRQNRKQRTLPDRPTCRKATRKPKP